MANAFFSGRYNTGAADPIRSPKGGFPLSGKGHLNGDALVATIPTTSLDANTDRHFICPMPTAGKIGGPSAWRLLGFWLKSDDLDSGGGAALDLDIVWQYYAAGVLTEDATPLYDASVLGAFSAAIATKWVNVNREIPPSDDGLCHAVLKTVTAASTAAQGDVTFIPVWV